MAFFKNSVLQIFLEGITRFLKILFFTYLKKNLKILVMIRILSKDKKICFKSLLKMLKSKELIFALNG